MEIGKVLVGGVSECNDDTMDSYFYEKKGRFPSIEEDEIPKYLLENEYPLQRKEDKLQAALSENIGLAITIYYIKIT